MACTANLLFKSLKAYRERRLISGFKKRLRNIFTAIFHGKVLHDKNDEKYSLFSISTSKYKHINVGNTIKVCLDLYVLGQQEKTGIYRLCDELFRRLVKHPAVIPSYLVRDRLKSGIHKYMHARGNWGPIAPVRSSKPSAIAEVLLSPFGLPPLQCQHDHIQHAHIICDLIALHHPEYFTPEAATEVLQIINYLDKNTIIFTISECTKNDLLAYRTDLSPEQIVVIPLAADAKFQPILEQKHRGMVRERYGIPSEAPFVLSLATLEVRKNLEQTVKAFIQYLEACPHSPACLVLAGMTGWKLERLQAEIAKAGKWSDRILLIGFVDDADLPALYSDALCFIYMSRYEGFGLPPLEAMACGTPVITSNTSSLPEVVGDAGMMFDPDDVDGVAHALAQLEASADLRNDFSRRGIERSKIFSWDCCCETVVTTLQTVTGKPS